MDYCFEMPLKTKLFIILLISFGVATWLSFQLDRPVRQAVLQTQGKDWKKTEAFKFHSLVRKWGDWPRVMLISSAGFLLAWRMRSQRWMQIIAAAMIASSLAGIIVNTSRLTTGRTRPRESPKIEQGFYGMWHDGKLLLGNSAFQSFPSAHTATSFGFAATIFFAQPLWGLLALAGAGLVAWSSIAIGAHHPSDVVVSIFIAFAVAWFVWQWTLKRGSELLKNLPGLQDPPQ